MKITAGSAAGETVQFQDGQIGKTVVFLVSCLLVEVVLEDGDVGWVVPIWMIILTGFFGAVRHARTNARNQIIDVLRPCRRAFPS